MRSFSWWPLLPAAIVLVAFFGCGGSTSTRTTVPLNPVPSISAVSPTTIAAGSAGFKITITGSGFLSSATVTWNGAPVTANIASTSIDFQIPNSELSTVRNVDISVTNPAPGGGTAKTTFTIGAPAMPVIAAVSPATMVPGQAATLNVSGANFVRNTVVQWNGADRSTTYVDYDKLTVTLAGTDVVGGTAKVTAATPAPGGGTSAPVSVAVQYPLPVISGLSPSALTIGSGDTEVTVTGSDFYPGALVLMDGISRVTTYVSRTEVRASMLAADVKTANHTLTVQNPSPSAGISNGFTLGYQYPAPVITAITPTDAVAGSQINVQVTGNNLYSAAIVVGGVTVSGTRTGTTLITATVPSTLLNSVGPVTVSVSNPPPGGGASNSVTINLTPSGSPVALIPMPYTRHPDSPYYYPNYLYPSGFSDDFRFFIAWTKTYSAGIDVSRGDTCWLAPPGCAQSENTLEAVYAAAAAISATGRYMVTGWRLDTGDGSLYLSLRDSCIPAPPGCIPGKRTVFSGAPKDYGTYYDQLADLTADGRYVLVRVRAGVATVHGSTLYDTCTGATGCTESNQVVSIDDIGLQHDVDGALSANGRYFVFADVSTTDATRTQLYLRDTCAGATSCTPSTRVLASRPVDAIEWQLAISGDGSVVFAAPLGLADTCVGADPGCVTTFTPVYTGDAIPFFGGNRYLGFSSAKSDIVANDTNNTTDAFIYDSCKGATSACSPSVRRMSVNSLGIQGDGATYALRFNADLSQLLMNTKSTNLGSAPFVIAPVH